MKLKNYLLSAILALTTGVGASAETWNDVTDAFLVNPAFDMQSAYGWDCTVSSYQNGGYQSAWYTNGDVWISGFYEVWIPSYIGSALGDGSIYQTTTLPEGKYRLHADAIATKQASQWGGGASSNVSGVSLFAVSNSRNRTKITTEDGKPVHYTVDFTLASQQEVDLGVTIASTTANWVAVDNFRLEKEGEIVPLLGMSMVQSDVQMEVGETTTLGINYIPENATYRRCQWYSTDESVVKVDNSGNIIAVSVGEADIIAESTYGEMSTSCHVKVTFTAPPADALTINEIQASNIDMFMDPSYNYGSWMEIYNNSSAPLSLTGLFITDDANNLRKHRMSALLDKIPAKGYGVVWFDHYGIWNKGEINQVSFKLNYDGGTIIISDGVNILAQQDYPAATSRTSYARTTDGGDTWGVSAEPTPGASNSGMTFATQQLAVPEISRESCLYTGGLSFKVTIPEGCTLRYTVDGTCPTLTNGSESTTGSFSISYEPKTYRFRLFRDGYLPSDPVTRSFLYNNRNYTLPIISVVTADATFNDPVTGLFKSGNNTAGRPGHGQDTKCNWNMDWDRPVNFEFLDFNENGVQVPVFSQEVDLSMCGGWSRAWTPHSFKLKAAKYYSGKNSMDYQFFDDKPFLKHKVLQIRNGGNDTGARLKDPALQEIVRRSGLYVDGQAWRPVHVFLNGSYYAVLNMREPNNKHFAYANYGIDTDLMDQFEMSPDSGYVQMEGTKEAFNRLYDLSYDAANNEVYEQIKNLIDVDEFINYMAVQLYLCNWDWPQNNVKGFRDQADGKFHFVLFDLDGAFSVDNPFSGFMGKQYYTFDKLRGEDGYGNSLWGNQRWGEIELVTLFDNLTKQPAFRKQFVDAFCLVAYSVFEPSRSRAIINEMNTILTNAGVNSSNTASTIINNLSSSRQTNMTNRLQNGGIDFGLSGKSSQSVVLKSSVEGAQMLVNGLPVPTGKFAGRLYSPVTLTAVAPAGYEFVGWQGTADTSAGSEVEIFGKGASWNYYDSGSLDEVDWKSPSFNASWRSGRTPIGYGKSDVITTVESYMPTYYFRKSVNLSEEPSVNDVFTLDYTVDDGMIVYVNGKEAGRYQMPAGNVSYETISSTYANGNPDRGTMTIPGSLFHKGDNVIAVEVHNYLNPSSTDAMWDAALTQTKYEIGESDFLSTDIEYTIPSRGTVNVTAIYNKVSQSNSCPIRINEVSAGNSIFVDDYYKKDDWVELYNVTSEPVNVDGWYLSDNVSKPKKFQITSADGQQTVVPAHGYLIVWASKRETMSDMIHASFKLGNNDGETVLLTSADETMSDTLTYVAHGGQESVGLYPDGGDDVYYFTRATILKPNYLTTYSEYLYTKEHAVDDPDSDGIETVEQYLSNSLSNSAEFFTLDGVRIGKDSARGIVIVRLSDGRVRKVRM